MMITLALQTLALQTVESACMACCSISALDVFIGNCLNPLVLGPFSFVICLCMPRFYTCARHIIRCMLLAAVG